uniref:Putative conserved plasma membrane protein n=2 Tax=Culex tarsalis TaxID=7177 RepID=A0A1Q3EY38_CULTA
MASSTNDDDNTIVNYHHIYVQQTNSNTADGGPADVARIDQMMSTNQRHHQPPPPPSYNQLPATPTTSSLAVQRNDVIIITGNNNVVTVAGPSSSSSRHHNRGEPPSYEEAINPDAPPPSYDSLFGRVREAHKSSTGMLDFLKNVVILLLGTLGCTIILGITIVIPVCMIVFGSIYLYDCPQGEYIPVYLLVGGGFGVLKQLLHLSTRVRSREEQELERLRQSPTQTLINCFMLGWFIIGSFWIYRIYEPNYDPAMGKYCNKSLYLFTFWLITSVYMTLGFVTVVLCGVSIISIAIHRRT